MTPGPGGEPPRTVLSRSGGEPRTGYGDVIGVRRPLPGPTEAFNQLGRGESWQPTLSIGALR